MKSGYRKILYNHEKEYCEVKRRVTMAIPGMSGSSPMDPNTPVAPKTAPEQTSETAIPMVDTDEVEANEREAEKAAKQQAAKETLRETINAGNATYYETNIVGMALDYYTYGNGHDKIFLTNLPEGTVMKDIKTKYNLPVGSLKHNIPREVKERDYYAPGSVVTVFVDDFCEATGLSKRELKGMFPENQYSHWYQLNK